MMRETIRRKKHNAGTYIALCILSVFVLIPIIYMVSTSFKTIDEILTAPKATLFPVTPSAEGYVNMWNKYPFVDYIKNSCIVVLASTAVAVLFSTLAGVYLPGEHCLLHGVECKFARPVFIGDVLTVSGTVTEVNETFREITVKAVITNQNGQKVTRGVIRAGVAV